jgi:hypothetical protein
MSLIEKIRATRISPVTVGKYTFTIRRPTDIERITLAGTTHIDILKKFVVGWAGVQEIDLVPGGTDITVPFDSELFVEWVSDQPGMWAPIIDGVLDAMRLHDERRLETEKKPDAG